MSETVVVNTVWRFALAPGVWAEVNVQRPIETPITAAHVAYLIRYLELARAACDAPEPTEPAR